MGIAVVFLGCVRVPASSVVLMHRRVSKEVNIPQENRETPIQKKEEKKRKKQSSGSLSTGFALPKAQKQDLRKTTQTLVQEAATHNSRCQVLEKGCAGCVFVWFPRGFLGVWFWAEQWIACIEGNSCLK